MHHEKKATTARSSLPSALFLLAGCAALAALVGLRAGASDGEVRISAIQGRSHYSPLAGRGVRSAGIVTAVAGRIVYVQDPEGDGDAATSDGIVLSLDDAPAVVPGDRIRFSGVVSESIPGGPRTANLSVTTIRQARLALVARDEPLPDPVVLGPTGPRQPGSAVISDDELPVNLVDPARARSNRFDPDTDAIDWFESLEGMRVRIPDPVAVSPLRSYSRRSSEVFTLADGGSGVSPSRRTRAGGILLQSGPANRGSQNAERIQVQLDGALLRGPGPAVSVGDRLGDVVGVLRYDFGNYEVAATAPLDVRPAGLRPDTTQLTSSADRVTLASYNVLNLSRAPEDEVQRALVARQIAGNLRAPDILALQEIQDDSGELDDGTTGASGTLRALADAIVAAGGPRYEFVEVAPTDGRPGGAPGGNIRNAFLYNPVRVALDSFRSLTPALLARTGGVNTSAFQGSRDPLIGFFTAAGRRLTVVDNHLSSRFGSTPVFGAVQPFVQAGERKRAAQADALRGYVAHLVARLPGARIAVVGDMNTFEFSDELVRLLAGTPPVLVPLSPLVPAAERYTYNFEGNSQTLDHVFVSPALRPGAELDIVHINADFPAHPGPAASDHDPVVARFR